MSKRIAVGIAGTRGESMILEGILTSMQIPATTELGNVMSEFADVAQGWIYVDEEGLNRDTIPLIEKTLGNIADPEGMNRYRDVAPIENVVVASADVIVARYGDADDARTMASLLTGKGVSIRIEESSEGGYDLITPSGALTRPLLEDLREYIGKTFEASAFDYVD